MCTALIRSLSLRAGARPRRCASDRLCAEVGRLGGADARGALLPLLDDEQLGRRSAAGGRVACTARAV
eukprot:6194600-Pleurochrysis_carterae.AAC.6